MNAPTTYCCQRQFFSFSIIGKFNHNLYSLSIYKRFGSHQHHPFTMDILSKAQTRTCFLFKDLEVQVQSIQVAPFVNFM